MATKAYAICKETKGKRDVYTAEEVDALVQSIMQSVESGLSGKSNTSHTHDDRYYTETEVNNKLAGKSDTSHNHDSRYYTETEVNNLFNDLLITRDYSTTISSGNASFDIGLNGYTALGIVKYSSNTSSNFPYYVGMTSQSKALLQYPSSAAGTAYVTVLYVKNIAA